MPNQPTPPIHILIIDDSPSERSLMTSVLEAEGHFISTASSGPEGLRMTAETLPELIVLDVMMPGMDGFEVCEQLRGSPHSAEVPIIMVTALSERQMLLRGIAAGADEFLTKPIDVLELRLRVATLARVGRYRQLVDARERSIAMLSRAHAAALESMRVKSEFLATLTHELRFPLATVLTASDLLLGALSGEEREWAQDIADAGHALLATVDDMLTYSRLDAGTLVLDSSPFDAAGALRDAVEPFRARAEEKGLRFDAELDGALGPAVAGDRARLQLALGKLLDNAVKFTRCGEVRVSASREDAGAGRALLRVEVRDTGVGVAEDVRPRLFQPFLQADGSTSRSYGGIGLGLAICRRLAELMGGEVGLAPGGPGATFWLRVPLDLAPQAG